MSNLSEHDLMVAKLVAEAGGFDEAAFIADTEVSRQNNPDMEINIFSAFNLARDEGNTHIIIDLRELGYGWVVSTIPTDWEFHKFVVKDGFATEHAAETYIRRTVPGAWGWPRCHVINFV